MISASSPKAKLFMTTLPELLRPVGSCEEWTLTLRLLALMTSRGTLSQLTFVDHCRGP